jgi:3-oxoacyl-[acyl-carrier-protein] synthase-3
MSTPTPADVRSSWRAASRSGTTPSLRIGLLAGYTIDPVVPYLGMALHDAGLPAAFDVGPFGQIVRQCLDDDGVLARTNPDVLIVAPRFEELGQHGPKWTMDLLDVASAAVPTIGRWSGAVVFVLPALPEARPFGAGDAGSAAGVVAEAHRARDAVRSKLAGLPNVYLADTEEAVRAVGSGRAHHPTMFRLAKVPYTEELFASLGGQLARVLGTRYGSACRAVEFDVDTLAGGLDRLREPVLELHRAGVRIAFRATGDVWDELARDCPELVEFAGEPGSALLITADPERGGLLLERQPESWPGQLLAAGLFDRPAPIRKTAAPVAPEVRQAASVASGVSLAGFVASLSVEVDFSPAREHPAKVSEVVARAKDFTLGNGQDADEIAGRADEVVAVSVRDRFGDYGVSGAVGLHRADGVCLVDLFSLSCPVLGKEVEDAVLGEILRRAEGDEIVFRFQDTGHNAAATTFLRTAAENFPSVYAGTRDEPAVAGPVVPFGIVAFGRSLPEPSDVDSAAPDYTTDLDRVRGWGYRTFHRAPEGVGLTDLAVAAGEQALAEAGVAAEDVDLVVLAMADLAEYLYWDPAAATQARLGASGAEALLVNQACGGGVAAFDLVAGKFAAHPGYRTALVIGANRVAEPYWNRMEINTSVYSDGAAAAVIRRDHGSCAWLATEIITDGTYADFMRMDLGGAARPFTAGDADQPQVRSPHDRLDDFFAGDVRKMFAFVSMIRTRSREVVDAACSRAGVARADLRRVIHFNDNVRQLADLAADFGVPVETTNQKIGLELGHVGCADQLLTLQRLLADGELAAGDLVALTSTSSGMHWGCTLLRV